MCWCWAPPTGWATSMRRCCGASTSSSPCALANAFAQLEPPPTFQCWQQVHAHPVCQQELKKCTLPRLEVLKSVTHLLQVLLPNEKQRESILRVTLQRHAQENFIDNALLHDEPLESGERPLQVCAVVWQPFCLLCSSFLSGDTVSGTES